MDKHLILSNLFIEALVSVSPSKKINIVNENSSDKIKRLSRSIGISSKYVCDKGQRFSTLGETGINFLINELNLSKDDIDAIIVVTQSPDYIIPGTAVLLQDRCGLSKDTLAYDINLGCSGYPYALFCAHGHLKSGMKRVLIVVGDQSYSPGTTDEGHGVLFGDACTVSSITLNSDNNSFFHAGTDGSGWEALYIPHGGKVKPVCPESFDVKLDSTGVMRSGVDVVLDGPAIHNFSVGLVPNELLDMISFMGLSSFDDIDYVFLHQANKMINNTIRLKLKQPEEKFPESLSDYGNTSSASVPITMTARANDKWNVKNTKLIMCGFGIGLSWSTLGYIANGNEKSFHIYAK